jgi:hypothetical protein
MKGIFLAVIVVACACKPQQKNTSAEAASVSVSDSRIAVRGTFGLMSLDSFKQQENGETIPVGQKFDAMASENRAEFELDSSGDGIISGMGQCVLSDFTAKRQASSIVGNSAWDGLKGGVGAVYLLVQIMGMLDCVKHPPGTLYKQSISVRTEYDLLGREVHTLSKNIGFAGGEKRDATRECKTMRGTRHVFIAERASACIGFEDAEAKKLKIIMVKNGDIYAIRIRMTRLQ